MFITLRVESKAAAASGVGRGGHVTPGTMLRYANVIMFWPALGKPNGPLRCCEELSEIL